MDTDQTILEALSEASSHLTRATELCGMDVTPVVRELLQTASALLKVRTLAWQRSVNAAQQRESAEVVG